MSHRLRYSVSLVTQGQHRFYTLTMPSDVLGRTCFVSRRHENPKEGFQRALDKNRAQDIANYVDSGGTIPTSIVLSTQPAANARIIGRGKTLEFDDTPKSFLVLDGQHRVYGFSLAKTSTRIPVVAYIDLDQMQETRLFIDINTKQRPVPNELLLDIKKQADYETEIESKLGDLYDMFNNKADSPLLDLLSPSERRKGKISRVTFYTALKPLIPVFENQSADQIYAPVRNYLSAFIQGANKRKAHGVITIPTVFRGALLLFPEAGQQVKDKYSGNYGEGNFVDVLAPMFEKLRPGMLKNAGNSPAKLHKILSKALKVDFTLT